MKYASRWRSGPHHFVQSRIAWPRSRSVGKIARCATRPVKRGGSLSEQDVAHLGPDAVGADDDVGFPPDAVLEHEPDCVTRRLQPGEAMAEGDRSGLDGRLEHRMQVAPVDIDVRAAEALLAGGIERELVQRLARVPGAADEGVRADARFHERALYAQAPQHLHHVGAEDDAGADAGKGRRLLVDGDGEPLALQEGRTRQSAEACPDNGDPVPAIQSPTPMRACERATITSRDAAIGSGELRAFRSRRLRCQG